MQKKVTMRRKQGVLENVSEGPLDLEGNYEMEKN
jgi:hypothetical protein